MIVSQHDVVFKKMKLKEKNCSNFLMPIKCILKI